MPEKKRQSPLADLTAELKALDERPEDQHGVPLVNRPDTPDEQPRTGLQHSMARIAKRFSDSAIRTDTPYGDDVELFIPGMRNGFRSMPTCIAQSSIFAPVDRDEKSVYRDRHVETRGKTKIEFSGEQLDESQADVWMQVLYEASKYALGKEFPITRSQILKGIGRDTGKWQYQWLHRTMKALCFAMITIETADGLKIGHAHAFHLVSSFDYDDSKETYVTCIDRRWERLYRNRQYILVNWEQRMAFRQHQDMAKSLHRLILTSGDEVQRYGLEFLKARAMRTTRMRDFRGRALPKAMDELVRVGAVERWFIGENRKGDAQLVLKRRV
jgi:hypothetical protein